MEKQPPFLDHTQIVEPAGKKVETTVGDEGGVFNLSKPRDVEHTGDTDRADVPESPADKDDTRPPE